MFVPEQKSLSKAFLCLNSRILPVPCMAIDDQSMGMCKFGPMTLWIPERVAMKYRPVNVNCQG